MTGKLRLGINIDHVATVRNARGGAHPDPVRAALTARDAGADGITAHLREDRRHIRDADLRRLKAEVDLPLNMEMAATAEMLGIALDVRPHAVCIVPERRAEVTTEGGLDVAGQADILRPFVRALTGAGVRVSLFIDPDYRQLEAAAAVGAPVCELHTGRYCDTEGATQAAELKRLKDAATFGAGKRIEMHAGHGLTFENVAPIAALPEIMELNIGHFLVGEAIFTGFESAIRTMRAAMDAARG